MKEGEPKDSSLGSPVLRGDEPERRRVHQTHDIIRLGGVKSWREDLRKSFLIRKF